MSTRPQQRPRQQGQTTPPPAPPAPYRGWWRGREPGSRWLHLASGTSYAITLTRLLDAMQAQGRRNGDGVVLPGGHHPGSSGRQARAGR